MKTICINLASRPDRWQEVSQEFNNLGLQVERLEAVSGDNRPLSFNQSVYKAMQLAGDDLMLFEDDVVFDIPAHINDHNLYFTTAIKFIPKDALTVHFGANILSDWKMPEPYNPHFAKLWNCYMSHATWYSKEAVQFILDHLDPTVLNEDNNIFDDWLRRKVLSQGRSYLHTPMIAYQRQSVSNIWGDRHSDYTACHIDGNKWLKRNV